MVINNLVPQVLQPRLIITRRRYYVSTLSHRVISSTPMFPTAIHKREREQDVPLDAPNEQFSCAQKSEDLNRRERDDLGMADGRATRIHRESQ